MQYCFEKKNHDTWIHNVALHEATKRGAKSKLTIIKADKQKRKEVGLDWDNFW